MKIRTIALFAPFLAASAVPSRLAGSADATSFAGRWEAVVVANDVEVPFPFEIEVDGDAVKGSFFNGARRVTSTSAEVDGDELTLRFEQYATALRARVSDGALTGEYLRPRDTFPFRASRASAQPHAAPSGAPAIEGAWIASANSNKGETAWRFLATQRGDSVEATILRVDGDTGTLTGSFRDGRFVLGHFSGARPLLVEVTPQEDGTLRLLLNGKTELRAARADTREAAAIGAPTDPGRHTAMKDPSEPLRFSFPDLAGRTVSESDERFQGKVVLVNVSGSWCPNCHDEAPFLAELYREYRSRGLEIVSLSFEEAAQLQNPERLRAFIETYGIDYTVLLAGEPKELAEKVPQAMNLNAFPTTFLVGRDGRVRAVHAGFPSPGSGRFYEEAEREMTEQVERLLAEPGSSSRMDPSFEREELHPLEPGVVPSALGMPIFR